MKLTFELTHGDTGKTEVLGEVVITTEREGGTFERSIVDALNEMVETLNKAHVNTRRGRIDVNKLVCRKSY